MELNTKDTENDRTDSMQNTGSSAYQIGQLSERITSLAEHLKKNKKDKHSRRGLLMMLSKRRKHLSYLKKNRVDEYKKVVAEYNLK